MELFSQSVDLRKCERVSGESSFAGESFSVVSYPQKKREGYIYGCPPKEPLEAEPGDFGSSVWNFGTSERLCDRFGTSVRYTELPNLSEIAGLAPLTKGKV